MRPSIVEPAVASPPSGGLILSPSPARIDSIDLVRGLAMVLMALDHVRDYFSRDFFTNPPIDPSNLTQASPALFLTRWVTHFCAPTFVFLAGTGIFLHGRHRSRRALSWFLLTRGLWLVLVEITLVRLSWNFNLHYGREFGGGVLWAIGWSMVLFSLLIFLPTSTITVLGVALIAFHNLLDGKHAPDLHLPHGLWVILHEPGQFRVFGPLDFASLHVPELRFGTAYCLLPWLGVLSAGYGFGALYFLDSATRRRQLFGLGVAVTLLFIALRYGNLYGDPPQLNKGWLGPWSRQSTPVLTVLSFINCQKYPPSLLFLLMTLGPAIIALAWCERPIGLLGRFFVIYGRVPVFYFILHIPLIHGLAVAIDYARFGYSPYRAEAPWTLPRNTLPSDYGFPLPVVYLIWLAVVLFLFPFCRWFARLKERSRSKWLSYL